MKWSQIPGKFIRADKRMALEVLFWLTVSRILIFHFKFSFIKRFLGTHMRGHVQQQIDKKLIRKLRIYVAKIGDKLPWECTCFVNAVTAKQVLKSRNHHSTIYFGVGRGDESAIDAHAWLDCGDITVVGGENKLKFTPISYYS